MTQDIENINNEIEVISENPMEILELKSAITKRKHSLEGLKSIFEPIEEWFNEPEDRSIDSMQFKSQRERKKTEQSFRQMWDTIKCTNIVHNDSTRGERERSRKK